MYQMTATLIDLTRQQMAGIHTFTTLSLSGVERAQQCALSITQQMMDRQLDALGRVTAQAGGTMLDTAAMQPTMDGLMRAQRDMVQTMSDTQRRCLDVMRSAQSSQPAPAEQLGDALQQAMQQWQQWTEQWLTLTRQHAQQWSTQVASQGADLAQAQADSTRAASEHASAAASAMQSTPASPTAASDPTAALLRPGLNADAQADDVSRRLEASAQSAKREAGREGKKVVVEA